MGSFVVFDQERTDLLAFLRALTDEAFLTDESLSDPFAPPPTASRRQEPR